MTNVISKEVSNPQQDFFLEMNVSAGFQYSDVSFCIYMYNFWGSILFFFFFNTQWLF